MRYYDEDETFERIQKSRARTGMAGVNSGADKRKLNAAKVGYSTHAGHKRHKWWSKRKREA